MTRRTPGKGRVKAGAHGGPMPQSESIKPKRSHTAKNSAYTTVKVPLHKDDLATIKARASALRLPLASYIRSTLAAASASTSARGASGAGA